jgi:Cdc6-like AAA superfamily ATPase
MGLDALALRVLWVLLAHEICPIARNLLRELNTENCADPTTDTLRAVAFGGAIAADAHRLFSNSSPLITARLIERTDSDTNAPDHRKTWKVAGRIVALAHEDLSLDPDLQRIATVVRPDEGPLGIGGEGIEAAPESMPALVAALRNIGNGTIVVQGPRGSGRRSLVRAAAAACSSELLEVDITKVDTNPMIARNQLAAVSRECRLFDLLPLLRDLDALAAGAASVEDLPASPSSVDRLELTIDALNGLPILATTSNIIPGNRLCAPQIIELAPISGAQRAKLWHRALPGVDAPTAELLATMYPVVPSLIDAASRVARVQADMGVAIHAHIRTGLRAVLDGRLAGLAHRIEASQDWDALVLPPDQRESIDELINRVKQRRTVYESWELGRYLGRGLGVSALFSGPPGTGKTMAAGLIAKELSTDLYQVDMSRIVSKWIGETEKNLAALFEAAEAGHAILLFDEADALFGKRTEVKSSNDRHANQETNYLLQRLEAFRGICILTTNNDTAIDEAFRRRIALHVHFPMPDVEERAQLWKSMLRPTIPMEGKLNVASLASRYEMSGGHIRNAVLRAAFAAASMNRPVTHELLLRAAQLEYQAMGRVMPSTL